MGYQSVIIRITGEHAEVMSDALLESGALSVEIEDAHAGTQKDEAIFAEPGMLFQIWAASKLNVLFPESADIPAILASVTALLQLPQPLVYEQMYLEEEDWVAKTQALSGPVKIGRIWIVPSWSPLPSSEGPLIHLDPGMAFGSGAHPTTRLCISWIDEHLVQGESVLDYGCGSGILAIVAARSGAGRVVGVDVDPMAISASRQNADLNKVKVEFVRPDASLAPFDLLVANILANPLIQLKSCFTSLVAPSGRIVLSGLLRNQASKLITSYAPEFDLDIAGEEEGWVLLEGPRTR
ncbi:MAG: 50S ribosomal protein L11 methyltransferase [Proteobacteria bacterium]|nr:50S ribosomal protein L11 methyltransferase [Pseudomonadota bacterium]MDE3207390.1 50S ribosomal protein L11 methyltransferase [Pseudomonadota bacterium]